MIITKETTIKDDAWGHCVVSGISMNLSDEFKVGDKVTVTIIVEKSE
jgi:hypothetical protein